MSDDFFDKIGKQLKDQATARSAADQTKATNLDLARTIVGNARTVADEYATKLKALGMNAEVRGHETYVSFSLTYADGEDQALSFGPDFRSGRLGFETHFREKGKPYKSIGATFSPEQWKDGSYESHLKSFINDFMMLADRHGGAGQR